MKAIHFYCRSTPRGPENFKPTGLGTGELGWWAISVSEATSLIGGWAYLHYPSTKPSYGAYRITSVIPASEKKWDGRYGFGLQKVPSVEEVPWRGDPAGQNPKHNYRIVDALLQHEQG